MFRIEYNFIFGLGICFFYKIYFFLNLIVFLVYNNNNYYLNGKIDL